MSKVKDDWTVKVFDSLAGLGIAALIIFFTVLSVMGRFADCNLSLLQGGHKKRGSK